MVLIQVLLAIGWQCSIVGCIVVIAWFLRFRQERARRSSSGRFKVAFDTEFSGPDVTHNQIVGLGFCLVDCLTRQVVQQHKYKLPYFHLRDDRLAWWPSTERWWKKELPDQYRDIVSHKNTISEADGIPIFVAHMAEIAKYVRSQGCDPTQIRWLTDTVSNDSSHMNAWLTLHNERPMVYWFARYALPHERERAEEFAYSDVICIESQKAACKVMGFFPWMRKFCPFPVNADAHCPMADSEFIGRCHLFYNAISLV